MTSPADAFIGRDPPIEIAWRLPAGIDGDGRRRFHVACRTVRGRGAARALAVGLAATAWNGELRLRVGSGRPFHTRALDVEFWPDDAALPRARPDALWAAEERRDAAVASFLSRLRPLLGEAGGRRIIHPHDARALAALATQACRGTISRPS